MSTGNIAWEMNMMSKGKAAITTTVFPVIQTSDGIVLCYSRITVCSVLSALCESQGIRFATGCEHICVHSDAVATILKIINYGTVGSAPSWYSVITAAVVAS